MEEAVEVGRDLDSEAVCLNVEMLIKSSMCKASCFLLALEMMIMYQDDFTACIAEQKSRDELEAKQNVEKVEEHLIAEEIEKLIEGTENVENVEVDNSISHIQNDPGTRLEPRSNKKSPEVEKTDDVSQPVNVIEEEDESAEDDYELRRREKGR
ncbi:hypothetical protein Tco_1130057, partial [Tanacetum coccineum]